MPRPKKKRQIYQLPNALYFKPQGIPMHALEEVFLTLDEAEALRLSDIEGLSQEQAANVMDVSRATFGRIVNKAHNKVADAIFHGKALRIEFAAPVNDFEDSAYCPDCNRTFIIRNGKKRKKACPNGHIFKGVGRQYPDEMD